MADMPAISPIRTVTCGRSWWRRGFRSATTGCSPFRTDDRLARSSAVLTDDSPVAKRAVDLGAAGAHHRHMSRSAAVRVARLPLDEEDIRPTFRRERAALKRGVWPVAGCDEAGRGPLAGPVVAAAVILDPKRVPRGLDDSKKLDRRDARKALRQDLRQRRGRGRDRAAGAHRSRQHPARIAVGAGARGGGAAGQAASSSSSTAATASRPAATARR